MWVGNVFVWTQLAFSTVRPWPYEPDTQTWLRYVNLSTKIEVSPSIASKIIIQTDTKADTDTDTHVLHENSTYPRGWKCIHLHLTLKWMGRLDMMLDFHYNSLIFNSCKILWMGTTLYGSFAMLLPAVNCVFTYGGIISNPISITFIMKGNLEQKYADKNIDILVLLLKNIVI